MHFRDLIISSGSILGIELISYFTISDVNDLITTGCQIAIAAATVYRLIKDKKIK